MVRTERQRRKAHWYDQTVVPRGGDAGLYFVIHRDIDKLRYRLGEFPTPETRAFLIPEITTQLEKLREFLSAYHMNVDQDMEQTLAEINPWLRGREISHQARKTR